jgi:WD40 repeat protein
MRAAITTWVPLLACAAAGGPAPQIYSLAWRPDGQMLALGGYKEVRLIDAARKPIGTLEGHAEAVRAVAFSRDGKLLAAAGGLPARKGEVKVWDLSARTVTATLAGHSDCIYAAAFSPDGTLLATASYDKLIKLWDVSAGKEVRTLRDHIDAVYALAFTPDGKRLVSGSADRSVKIWDVATGARLYTLSEPTDGINAIALSPDGTRVAAGGFDKTIRIWSLGEKEGKLENSLIAHEDAILKLAWSPDGQYLASAAADRTAKIFRAADLSEVRSLANLPDWAFGLEFAPRGQLLAAGFFNGQVEMYEVDHAKTLAAK